MRSFVVRMLIMALFSGAAAAAEPWQQELAGPLVKIAAGQMIFEEFELCAIPAYAETGETRSIQVKTRGEAPAGAFISRDYFVALMAVLSADASEQVEVDCKPLASLIGKPDVENTVRMTKDGFQFESRDNRTGQSETVTTRWQDLFAE